jgi:hypothetical protein
VGLSPLKVGGPHLNGFLDQIDSSKVISPIFSFYLTANGGEGSALTFGGYDVEKFAKKGSKLRWIPIDAENSNFWSLAMASEIKMGD